MPGRISHNIIFLSYNLDVNLFLDHLLEQDILDIAEYTAVAEKEDDKFQSARRLARHLLTKTSAQIDKFLEILEEHQPGVARHVVATMRKRREGAGNVSSTGSTTANNGASSVQSKAARVAENREGQSRAASSATASSGVSSTSAATTTPGAQTTSASQPLTSELPQADKNFVGRNDLVCVVCDKILQPPAKKSKSIEVQSLVGPPGFGKTSIAVAVGRTCQEAGMKIEFINLRGVSDISTVHTLVQIRLKEADSSESNDSQDEKGKVKSTSPKPKSKQPSTLVILDNAEDCMTSNKDSNVQLQDVIKSVLSSQPENGTHVLLTSRVQFEVHATEFRMEQHNVGCLDPSHAVQLLENLCVDNCMTTEQASTIVQYCGYVPLAIRIATGLLLRNSARNLVQLFEEIGLSVFKDDNLKPQHRILFLLKLALDQLPAKEKEMFHALSQLPTSFSSAAACAVVNYAGESTAVVHLLHFDRLVKICFLEYNRESDRYSMQAFISEFGRHECPENDCDTYRQRLSMFYLTWLTELSEKCPVGVEESAYLSLNFIVDIANVAAALEWSVLLSTDDLVQYIPLATGPMCSYVRLAAMVVFLERIQSCQSSMTQEQYSLCLLNACFSSLSIDNRPEALAKCEEWLGRASDSVEKQDGNQLHLQLDISVWKMSFLLLSDLENGSKELCAASLAALESLSCICTQILNEQEVALSDTLVLFAEMLKISSSSLLGDNNLDLSTLERITAAVVQRRYLSSTGEALSVQCSFDLLELMYMILESCLSKMEENPGFVLTASLLRNLSPALCTSKRVYSPLQRHLRDILGSFKRNFQSYLMYGVGGVLLTSSSVVCTVLKYGVNLGTFAGRTCGFQFVQNLLRNKSILHATVSQYVTNYMLRVNGSHSDADGGEENVLESFAQLATMEKSCIMDCLLLTDRLLGLYGAWKETVPSQKGVFNALVSLKTELCKLLPDNSALGMSVSTVVYTASSPATLSYHLLPLLHHQSKQVSGVDVDAHLELLQWSSVAPACFVCYTMDDVEKCPRCQMAWLCTKHRVSHYQAEHNKHCHMLRAHKHLAEAMGLLRTMVHHRPSGNIQAIFK